MVTRFVGTANLAVLRVPSSPTRRYLDIAWKHAFDALVRFACLRLGRRLGTEVTPALTRKEIAEPQLRVAKQVAGWWGRVG